MPTGARKPDVTIKARIGKTYDAKQRGGTLIEFHIPFAEWGKLQEIVLREASRGFGFKWVHCTLAISP